jgi:hypothetical protein
MQQPRLEEWVAKCIGGQHSWYILPVDPQGFLLIHTNKDYLAKPGARNALHAFVDACTLRVELFVGERFIDTIELPLNGKPPSDWVTRTSQ